MMRCWGIWIYAQKGWMLLSTGAIFWTNCRAVAEVQLSYSSFTREEAEVRDFECQ